MATQEALHFSLLRPAVIHILRAAGFHSTKSSVLDAVTDLAARYLFLLATNTAVAVEERIAKTTELDASDEDQQPPRGVDLGIPTISDIRQALDAASFFSEAVAPSEQAWTEALRRPLSQYPAGASEKEQRRRDAEDTRDVREFIDWTQGPVNREIHRIAGLLKEDADIIGPPIPGTDAVDVQKTPDRDDYLAALKKKHSKTGDGQRYAGTALGKPADDSGTVRIEGGPESLSAWTASLHKRKADEAVETNRTSKR